MSPRAGPMLFVVTVTILLDPHSSAMAATSADAGSRSDDTPLQKVLDLLESMLAKGKLEKHTEEVEFEKFREWCDGSRAAATKAVEEADVEIEQLSADIVKAEADAEDLAAQMEELEVGIARKMKESHEAEAIRERDQVDYLATHEDFSESLKAIDRAIAVLQAGAGDVAQSMLQVQRLPQLPQQARSMIEAFLGLDGQSLDHAEGVPEANAYEFHSDNVLVLLKQLRLKFQDQKLALEKEEANAKSNYELLVEKLSDDLKAENTLHDTRSAQRARRLQDAATAKGELDARKASREDDQKRLSSTLAKCHRKSGEFEKNQVVRSEEIKAIETAVGILQSDTVSGSAERHLPPTSLLIQRGAGGAAALVQLRGGGGPGPQHRVAALLRDKAHLLGSRYLRLAAAAAESDPLAEVRKMIQDLIAKLKDEAVSEADHKAYCSAELATNKQTREDKQTEVEELSAELDKKRADSLQFHADLQDVGAAIAELRKEQAEASKMRDVEKSRNTQTITEAKEAQVAVEKAMQVLKEFYAKVADDESLMQTDAGLGQEMSNVAKAPYAGMQAEHGGIIGFLQVVLSDFARLETETSFAEGQAQEDHESYMAETTESIAVKDADMEHRAQKKRQTDAMVLSLAKELELTQSELLAAKTYYEKLKPDCVNAGVNYNDRVTMRQAEIQSLKEALEVLSQQDLS
eukprot:CAMPEP_0179064418 /NCGR_PEP_ID=MMETSP0796-20121207/27939_1 /TAXON_ID=73915 /ORGANISM="Pyrodinium bahamense, Strain pbaha01" /LENGTH=690 /DNA_ID=CAMNT_0020761367 /DNA_START=89 /DNA_END=2161 /DNA_ORIENTATION=+